MKKDKMKILIFGNSLVEEDSLPIKLLPKLKQKFPDIEFKEFDPTESLENEGRNLLILDVIKGVDKITIIEEVNQLGLFPQYSMHDFDLGFNLKLLKKLGKIDSVKIIGIPINSKESDVIKAIDDFHKEEVL